MRFRNVSIFKPKRRNKKHHPWLIAYGTGENRKTVTASTDLAATRELAERLSIISQNAAIGLGDPVDARIDIERRRPLTHHLNDFEQSLVAAGNTAKHAAQMRLYAIQHADSLISLEVNELRDKHKRRIAPRAAQRLLRKLASNALNRFNTRQRKASGR